MSGLDLVKKLLGGSIRKYYFNLSEYLIFSTIFEETKVTYIKTTQGVFS
jgi:hypothetical protein